MARANDAARVEGTDSAPTSMPPAVRMAIEKAKEPPPSALNAKVPRTQEGRSMVVAAMVAAPRRACGGAVGKHRSKQLQRAQ